MGNLTMEMKPATRNPENLSAGQILSRADLFTVYDWALNHGYTGHMNGNGPDETVGITAPGGNVSQTARIGDWAILKNDTVVTLVPQEQAAGLYSITG